MPIGTRTASQPSLARPLGFSNPRPGHLCPVVRSRGERCSRGARPHPRVFYAMSVAQLAQALVQPEAGA